MRHDNTSPATTHLARVHGIRSRKTRSMLKNRAIRQQKLERSHRLHHLQPERFFGLQSALFLIDGCLPFTAVTRPTFSGLFVGMKFPRLYPEKIKSYFLQIFHHLKQEITKKFIEMKECCSLPFIHLSVDLYTSKILNLKFIGIRVTYTDVTNNQPTVCSYNLAIRFLSQLHLKEMLLHIILTYCFIGLSVCLASMGFYRRTS